MSKPTFCDPDLKPSGKYACDSTQKVGNTDFTWGKTGRTTVCGGVHANAADHAKNLSGLGIDSDNIPTNNYDDPNGMWSCFDQTDWNSQINAINKRPMPSSYDSSKPIPVDPTPPYAQMPCVFPGPNPKDDYDPDGPNKTVEYAVYSKNGGWKTLPNPNGTYDGTPGLGAWWSDGAIPTSDNVVGPGSNLSKLSYIYCPPNSLACVNAAVKAGMGIPHGCQFVKPNISNKTTTKPTKETFTDDKGGVDKKSGTTFDPSSGQCSAAIMGQMKSTCTQLNKAKENEGKMCKELNKQNAELQEKLKSLQNNEPWYQTLINKVGGVVDDMTPGGLAKNIGLAIKEGSANNKVAQQLNNALGINININQSQQSRSMCLNNSFIQQDNVAIVKACPNPYPDLIKDICGTVPKCPCKEDKDGNCIIDDSCPQKAIDYLEWTKTQHANCMKDPQTLKMIQEYDKAAATQFNKPANINIDQKSKAHVKQNCDQNVQQKALVNFAAGINNQVTQLMAQHAENAADNQASQKNCNDVNINMSACNYQSTNACCSNTSGIQQNNMVSVTVGCSPINANVNQQLQADVEQLCVQGVKQNAQSKGQAQITNKIKQAATQVAIGANWMTIFIIFAIIIGIILLSPIGLTFVLGSKIILIMGVILVLIGVAQIIPYIMTKYDKGCNHNSPFIFTTRSEAEVLSYRQTTFKEAMDTYNNNQDIKAFDFIPGCLNMSWYLDGSPKITNCETDIKNGYHSYPEALEDPKVPGNYIYPDQTLGMAIYYKTLDKSVKGGVPCTQRGNPGSGDPSSGGATPTAYRCKLNPTKSYVTKQLNDESKQEIAQPVFENQPSDTTTSGTKDDAKKSCTEATAQSCEIPSVSYYKASSMNIWLYSAIATASLGLILTLAGIWVISKPSTGTTGGTSTTYREGYAKAYPANKFNFDRVLKRGKKTNLILRK